MTQFDTTDDKAAKYISSKSDVVLKSDSDADGVGDLVFISGNVERARITQAGVGSGAFAAISQGVQVISVTSTASGVTTAAPDFALGAFTDIQLAAGVTGTVAIPNPLNPPGATQTGNLRIQLNAAGTIGTVSWGTAYIAAATLPVKPGNTKKRVGEFSWNGAEWVCVAAPAVDY